MGFDIGALLRAVVAMFRQFPLISILVLGCLLIATVGVTYMVAKVKTTPISISRQVQIDSLRVNSTPEMWINTFYVVIGNDDPARTLKNVSADLHTLEGPNRCPIRGTDLLATNIRNGEHVYFRSGQIVSLEAIGLSSGSVNPSQISEEMRKNYLHNLPLGYVSFEPSQQPVGFTIRDNEQGRSFAFTLAVTGEDIPSAKATVKVGWTNKKPSITITVNQP
jgi:hypothetical protein